MMRHRVPRHQVPRHRVPRHQVPRHHVTGCHVVLVWRRRVRDWTIGCSPKTTLTLLRRPESFVATATLRVNVADLIIRRQ